MSEAAAAAQAMQLEAGRPYPLGATLLPDGINFAVFSAHAKRIDLCLFDAKGEKEIARLRLPACTHQVWHGYLPKAGPGTVYGFRAFGRFDPKQGHRFNAHKLLVDPYARQLTGPCRSVPLMRGDAVTAPEEPATYRRDRQDSAAVTPKALVLRDDFDWLGEKRPNTPLADSVIYEVHVRGASMLRQDLPEHLRGTFAGLADPRFIAHLQQLGVTAIELLPVHAILHDRFLLASGLSNYWGYNSLNFFAIHPQYLSGPSLDEVRQAIKALHQAGIEVILDVVYNHTCEGDERGPTVNFRGLDNISYYALDPQAPERYLNYTGCGNTLAVAHPRVLQMVLDSLRYFVLELHIDGFRFDLAPTLARNPLEYDVRAGFFGALMQDPVLSQVKLIAEPWDIGPNGYRLGQFPAGFSEWNDKYRDCVRRFWRGDAGMRGEFASRLSGSPDVFEHDGRSTDASLNFVTAHDGFTLQDVVSYAKRYNLANGENNRDGTDNNCSSNWGAGDGSNDPAVASVRENVKRAMLVTLFMSHGVPMLLAGDEFGRTQNGNNNAYCQDAPLSWIDWGLLEQPAHLALHEFVCRLSALRRDIALARWPRFLHGLTIDQGLRDTDWFDCDGSIVSESSWSDPSVKTLAMRRYQRIEQDGLAGLLVLFNASESAARFVLPPSHRTWTLRLDSSNPMRSLDLTNELSVELAAHAAAVFTADDEATHPHL